MREREERLERKYADDCDCDCGEEYFKKKFGPILCDILYVIIFIWFFATFCGGIIGFLAYVEKLEHNDETNLIIFIIDIIIVSIVNIIFFSYMIYGCIKKPYSTNQERENV